MNETGDTESFFEKIRQEGFDSSLSKLLAFAEAQTELHQAIGDQVAWNYWCRCWAALQKASDSIDFPENDRDAQEMWREHQENYQNANIDFNFDLE